MRGAAQRTDVSHWGPHVGAPYWFVPGVSMTLKKWGEYPKYWGH